MVDEYLTVSICAQRFWAAPLTNTTALTALENICHLADLTELSLTLNDFATAALIHRVASVFPTLRFLEFGNFLDFGNSPFLYGAQWPAEVHDPTVLDALQRFPLLTHLGICLHFGDPTVNLHVRQRRAARWLLASLPNLRTVAFSWGDMLVWREWDRRLFLCPPSPPTPPRSPIEDVVPMTPLPY